MSEHMERSRVCSICRKCAYCYVITKPHDCDFTLMMFHDHPEWNRIPWKGPRVADPDDETIQRLIETGRA